MPISNQGFEYGVYPVLYGIRPTNLIENGFTTVMYGASNIPPRKTTLISPVQGVRVSQRPTFVFDSPASPTGARLHFVLQMATMDNFTAIPYVFTSRTNQAGWEFSTDGGTTYAPVPSNGVSGACRVRFTIQSDVTINTYYWRALGDDGTDYSITFDTVMSKVGDRVVLRLKTPIKTNAFARSLVPVVMRTLATDGANPAQMKLFVTNNGFDANPVWEDASIVANGQGVAHAFSNQTKTATDWGVDVRIELLANDSTGAISLDGFGFTFN